MRKLIARNKKWLFKSLVWFWSLHGRIKRNIYRTTCETILTSHLAERKRFQRAKRARTNFAGLLTPNLCIQIQTNENANFLHNSLLCFLVDRGVIFRRENVSFRVSLNICARARRDANKNWKTPSKSLEFRELRARLNFCVKSPKQWKFFKHNQQREKKSFPARTVHAGTSWKSLNLRKSAARPFFPHWSIDDARLDERSWLLYFVFSGEISFSSLARRRQHSTHTKKRRADCGHFAGQESNKLWSNWRKPQRKKLISEGQHCCAFSAAELN